MNRIFTNDLNPLYHLGSLSFYLFWIILVSGIYVFVFFETNLGGAYASVEYMTHDQWWLAGVMRSLHRYASDGVVITITLHMFREFFRDRYRGIRWFSWFTGVPTMWLVVMLGISGYWLVWDELAQYVALATAELFDWLPISSGSMTSNFLSGRMTDRFFTLLSYLHLVGLPVGLVFLLWTHVSRISKVAFMPPRALAVGTLLSLTLLSLIKPAISHGPATMAGVSNILNIDWFYLNIYPLADRMGAGWAWGIPSVVTLVLMMLPWLPPRKELSPPEVVLEACNGCQQCARDCPFGAISMELRKDGRPFKFQPTVEASLCTACGICVGGCHYANPFRKATSPMPVGVDMPHFTTEALRHEVDTQLARLTLHPKVVLFGCQHGADITPLSAADTATVVLPCSGMLPPSFVDYVLKRGADGVLVTGCRDRDCYYRIGNRIVQERLERTRPPHLPKRVDDDRHLRRFPASFREYQDLVAYLKEFRATLPASSGREVAP